MPLAKPAQRIPCTNYNCSKEGNSIPSSLYIKKRDSRGSSDPMSILCLGHLPLIHLFPWGSSSSLKEVRGFCLHYPYERATTWSPTSPSPLAGNPRDSRITWHIADPITLPTVQSQGDVSALECRGITRVPGCSVRQSAMPYRTRIWCSQVLDAVFRGCLRAPGILVYSHHLRGSVCCLLWGCHSPRVAHGTMLVTRSASCTFWGGHPSHLLSGVSAV